MENTTHSKAVQQNLIHMGSSQNEWSALTIEKFTVTENNKGLEIVMPEFKFPANYQEAPTLYKGDCCGWCGHKIKNVFWIVNHKRQWILPVGSECIKSFIELTEDQEQELKAISTVKLEEVKQINNRIESGETVKQAIATTKKYNTIEKRFLKKYPMPDETLEIWWESVINKWDYSWCNNINRDFQYWGLNWYGLNWPESFYNSINYLRLPKPDSGKGKTALELWGGFKKRYIEKKLSA